MLTVTLRGNKRTSDHEPQLNKVVDLFFPKSLMSAGPLTSVVGAEQI